VAGVGEVDGRKVRIDVEVRDGPPEGGGDDGDGGCDGEVFARGSALFVVLAKD